MPPANPFPHLPLLLRYQGDARIPGGGGESEQTKTNKANASTHSETLRGKGGSAAGSWQSRQSQRQQNGLPILAQGMPILLKIDPSLDLDILRDKFSFEIVSEQEDGYVIVASEDLQLSEFLKMAQEFATQIRGSATIASIHELLDDPTQEERLKRILSESLFEGWSTISDTQLYIVDVGIACAGTTEIPNPPKEPERSARDSDARWAARQAEYARKRADWAQNRSEAYAAWDNIKAEREERVSYFIERSYQGKILNIIDNQPVHAVELPDSFTVRIQVNGKGLRDFVLNYPYIFEVVEPEEIELPQKVAEPSEGDQPAVSLTPPDSSAPAVCVIDSGIQEEHSLLQPAIDRETSFCFLSNKAKEIGDYVRPAGHGTRVAGAVLFGDSIPRSGQHQLPCWIQNARILDADCKIPLDLFPAAAIRAAIERFHESPRKTRLFNHSINTVVPCRTRHMSAWAAEIDLLSARLDILVVQSAGNLYCSASAPFLGIKEHIAAGRDYPGYLCEPSSRIGNPAQSLQALTVGSVAHRVFENSGWKSLAGGPGHPSAFSRSGFGIWDVIKPEVVEFGGDNLRSPSTPPDVAIPSDGRECYPELVRSTMFPPGPAVDRDQVGTSFAAPKVTHIAAQLQNLLPEEPCLLYRALIVQSARWPEWTRPALEELQTLKQALPKLKRKKNRDDDLNRRIEAAMTRRTELEDYLTNLLRMIGYGIPDLERATTNTAHRTTFITSGATSIKAGEGHIYQVPIPEAMRRPGDDFDILIEVTLSYVARPRRTRRNLRRYLSTWAEWKCNGLDESIGKFRARALKDYETEEEGDSNFGWTLGTHPGHGIIKGAKRSSGTVQKDWAVKKSSSLPESFCIAVVGHEGWSLDPDATAQYALCVSFEILGKQIPIYELQKVAIEELQAEIEAEEEIETEVQVSE